MKATGNAAGNSNWFLMAAGPAVLAGAILFGSFVAKPVHAQAAGEKAAASAPIFEFEVATVKLYKPGADEAGGGQRMGIMNSPDGFSARGVTLQGLLQFAYNVQNNQISGGPDWVNSERFEIDAKMDSSVADALQKLSPDDRMEARRRMLQKLLTERFKMVVEKDSKELPVYNLVVAKNGSKLHEVATSSIPPIGNSGPGGHGGGAGTVRTSGRGPVQTMTGKGIPIANLTRMLSFNVGRPVVDKTGLNGFYDVNLQWVPEQALGTVTISGPDGSPTRGESAGPSAEFSAPSIFVAMQEQLGLKLESGKGPVDLIVVKSAEKPSDN